MYNQCFFNVLKLKLHIKALSQYYEKNQHQKKIPTQAKQSTTQTKSTTKLKKPNKQKNPEGIVNVLLLVSLESCHLLMLQGGGTDRFLSWTSSKNDYLSSVIAWGESPSLLVSAGTPCTAPWDQPGNFVLVSGSLFSMWGRRWRHVIRSVTLEGISSSSLCS